jgi:hypothetical protein
MTRFPRLRHHTTELNKVSSQVVVSQQIVQLLGTRVVDTSAKAEGGAGLTPEFVATLSTNELHEFYIHIFGKAFTKSHALLRTKLAKPVHPTQVHPLRLHLEPSQTNIHVSLNVSHLTSTVVRNVMFELRIVKVWHSSAENGRWTNPTLLHRTSSPH